MAGQYKKCCEYQSKDHLSPTTALQHVADVKCQSVSCRASSFHLLTLAAADTVGWWPVWFHILGFILSKMGVKVYTLNPQNIRMGESFSHTGQVQKKQQKKWDVWLETSIVQQLLVPIIWPRSFFPCRKDFTFITSNLLINSSGN